MWDNAQRHDEGRFLALPILTAKNDTAQSFGQYDLLASGPQSLYSVASMPWSWYQTAVSLDYITVKLVRGPNMRVDNLTTQIETAIGSITDLLGQDTCSTNKGRTTQHGNPLVGIYEACDAGATFDVYANIARLGTNSFSNWQGQVISLATTNIGTASNDAARSQILRNYTACVVGDAAPTHIMGHQQAVSSYMFTMDSQVRVSPGDAANPSRQSALARSHLDRRYPLRHVLERDGGRVQLLLCQREPHEVPLLRREGVRFRALDRHTERLGKDVPVRHRPGLCLG